MSLINKIKSTLLSPKDSKSPKYLVSDITIIYCIRLTSENAWVAQRLAFIAQWLDPLPTILVVDYGSESHHKNQLKKICESNHLDYYYRDEKGVFSLSKARNTGFSQAKTELLFFSDPDFIFERDLFARLLKIANAANFHLNTFNRITLPAYHFSSHYTDYFDSLETPDEKEDALLTCSLYGVYSEYPKIFEFISPYSNSFLCHQHYFDLVGGYSSYFEGHGSEDFEFMIRANLMQGKMPIPDHLDLDISQSTLSSTQKNQYQGFRRLGEVETFSGELLGLKSFHLWHPRTASPGWYENNDIKRQTLKHCLSRYVDNRTALLKEDYLPRNKHALAIIPDESQVACFFPLRVLGYSFYVLTKTSQIKEVIKQLDAQCYDCAFIGNSGAKKAFSVVLEQIKRSGLPVTQIGKGALPNSLYYADALPHADTDFLNLSMDGLKKFCANSAFQSDPSIIDDLKASASSNDCKKTQSKLDSRMNKQPFRFSVFIPLPLPVDITSTQFNAEHPGYNDFLKHISDSITTLPDIYFLLQSPTLASEDTSMSELLNTNSHNVLIVKKTDHVHVMIERVDAVIVYNSDVGLTSLLHHKPAFHFGNAYYATHQHFSTRVESIRSVIDSLEKSRLPAYTLDDVICLIHWLIHYKYSFFVSPSRKNEPDIQVEILNFKGKTYTFGTHEPKYDYSSNSYAAAKLGVQGGHEYRQYIQKHTLSSFQAISTKIFTLVTFPYLTARDKNLLKNDPKQFFKTAKHPFSVWVGDKIGLT